MIFDGNVTLLNQALNFNFFKNPPPQGPPRREPWGCIPGLSDMETDRPLEIGNLRKKCAWGAFFPQIANRPCSVCRGDMALTDANPAFGRIRRIWVETAQPMRQNAIQGLLSRFRWSGTTLIVDGFLADLNRALSALFFKI